MFRSIYCCGINNTTCCVNGDSVWIRDGLPTRNSTDASENSSTQTTTAAVTTTTAASSDNVSSPPRSKGLSGGAIAGIAIVQYLNWRYSVWRFGFWPRRRRGKGQPQAAMPTLKRLQTRRDTLWRRTASLRGPRRSCKIRLQWLNWSLRLRVWSSLAISHAGSWSEGQVLGITGS